ncbi:hypothetical protein HDU93_003936, partial [Gonapodya sp. JEL0774]
LAVHCPIHLGLVWDLKKGTLPLTPARLRSLRHRVKQAIRKDSIPLWQAASILGTLQSTHDTLSYAQLQALPLLQAYNRILLQRHNSFQGSWNRLLVISPAIYHSLQELLQHLHQWNGVSFLPPKVDLVITSDTLETGSGANLHAAPAPPFISTTTSKGDQLTCTSACWLADLLIRHLHTLYSPTAIWAVHPVDRVHPHPSPGGNLLLPWSEGLCARDPLVGEDDPPAHRQHSFSLHHGQARLVAQPSTISGGQSAAGLGALPRGDSVCGAHPWIAEHVGSKCSPARSCHPCYLPFPLRLD